MAQPQAQGHNQYLPGYGQVKHHEWRTAENSAAYLIPTLQAMAKQNPELELLDVGAGSGTITATLARYMPEGHITATDLSPDILEKAKSYATQHGANYITFQSANIYELPFKDETFDVVHASMVLSHLDSPVQAYKEMLRVTKPGGVVANRESDLRMWNFYPDLPGMHKFHAMQLETMKAAGGNIDGGAKMVSWAMKAGAKRERITATMGTWTYSTPEERRMWGGSLLERTRNGEMSKAALEKGSVTEEDLDEMCKAWEEWIEAEDGVFGSMHGEILIRK